MSRQARRELAVRAFWSDHPLCRLYEISKGYWIDGRYQPAQAFSLRELICFAETLPDDIVDHIAPPDHSAQRSA